MRALIIGALGQDGRLLSDILKNHGFDVSGVIKSMSRASSNSTHTPYFQVDMSDGRTSREFLNSNNPDYIFHLGAIHAPSHTMKSLESDYFDKMHSCHVGITEHILQWQKSNPMSRSLIALSSQMFLNNPAASRVINEDSDPDSESPYGISKRKAWQTLMAYRNDYGINASGAILFNHTSSLSKQGFLFPTLASKIHAVIEGKASHVEVLNEMAEIDISYAGEICEAMLNVVSQEVSGDFVLGSGGTITINSLLSQVAKAIGVDFGVSSINEPQSARCLESSIAKAKLVLKWEPKTSPAELLVTMTRQRMVN
jgi:GDPmannose 4,6-dehydratase